MVHKIFFNFKKKESNIIFSTSTFFFKISKIINLMINILKKFKKVNNKESITKLSLKTTKNQYYHFLII